MKLFSIFVVILQTFADFANLIFICAKIRGRPTATTAAATVDLPFKDIVQVLLIGPSIGFAGLLTHMVGMRRGVGASPSPSSPSVRETCCQPAWGGGGARDTPQPGFFKVYGVPETVPKN